MKSPIIFLLALLSSAITITPVVAAPPAAATRVVTTADLDLGSAVGQRLLDRRLMLAIADVCGTASDADLAGQNEVRRCRVDTRQRVARDRDQRLAERSHGSFAVAAR